MTRREAQIDFEKRLRGYSEMFYTIAKPSSTTILSYIDFGITAAVAALYSIYERDQKITDDLRLLTTSVLYSSDDVSLPIINEAALINHQSLQLPVDYLHMVSDSVNILPVGNNLCWATDYKGKYVPRFSDVIECTHENLQARMANSLSEHRLRYSNARPLRVMENKSIKLYSDGNYLVSTYELTYLRLPSKIQPDINTVDNMLQEYVDLTDTTLKQAIEVGVTLYIQSMQKQEQKPASSKGAN
jgi:hypothetical protein